jgi:two-component system, NtrC family, response regulator AtoC
MEGKKKVVDILVVDDERPTCEFLAQVLSAEGHQVTSAYSGEEAIRLLKKNYYPVVVSDLQLGDPDGLTLLTQTNLQSRASAMIFITGYGSIDTAVRAIHEGAFDYLSKPLNLADIEVQLKGLVQRAIQHLASITHPKKAAAPQFLNPSFTMIGTSPQIVQVYRTIAKAAISRSNVLVLGESGTGKELVARAIHDNSPRSAKPFVTVNCCALTESLLESELFGHVKGSFTGAIANKRGLFEEANEGTIFLDEIGDISPALQVKLLRVIQEGEVRPVGASETRNVDVRVIAATHRDLDAYVKEGKFREDLYYRLKIILIELPPLRQRNEDLPDLVKFFVSRSLKQTGKPISSVSEEAMTLLMNYPWPGNIRELENALERAIAMTNTTVLFPEDFPSEIIQYQEPRVEESPREAAAVSSGGPQSLEQLEREHIIKTLEEVKFNKSKAAHILGIDRVTLYRKASRYGIPMRSR